MEYNWNNGDKLKVIDIDCQNNFELGEIVIADNDVYTTDGHSTEVLVKGRKHEGNTYYPKRFKKVGKATKIKQKNFRVIQESCDNFIGDYATIDEALKQLPPADEEYMIYKKVAIATSESKIKIKRIK